MLTSSGYVDVVIRVLAALLIIFQLPPILISYSRKAYNRWSLMSRRRTLKRLTQLEGDLKLLDEPPPIEERQAQFYVCVLGILSAIAAGLLPASWYFYTVQNQGPGPNPFLALAVVCFFIAAIASLWGMNQFQFFLQSHRKARRLEIEHGIKAMKDKLASTTGEGH
jgi:hypothetical protein